MLAMTRSPRQPSNLHWSIDVVGSVKHTYSKNQITAVLQEVRRAEIPSDTPTPSMDSQMNEPDTHRPSGLERRAFGDDVTNVGQQGKEGITVQTSPKRKKPRGRRSLDRQDTAASSALTTAPRPRIVDERMSGECPVSREFLKIVNRVGRAHGLIVRDPSVKMKVWAAILVACHARFDPRAHLAFSRFLFAWGSEYARDIKRKSRSSSFYSTIRSERRDQKDRTALPSDEDFKRRRALHFTRDGGDSWRPYAMEEAARRAEDERRVLQFVLQSKADTARRKAEEAKRLQVEAQMRASVEEERCKAEERVQYLVGMMMRETTKQQAESAHGMTREAVARTTERSKGSSVGEALAHESAEQKASPAASHNDQTAVSDGVVKGSEQPKGSTEGPSADGSAYMMQRQAASKSPKASRKGTTPAPPIRYRSNGELKAYPTREDLQACWAALFDGRAIQGMR